MTFNSLSLKAKNSKHFLDGYFRYVAVWILKLEKIAVDIIE